jgi:hypothetical protein
MLTSIFEIKKGKDNIDNDENPRDWGFMRIKCEQRVMRRIQGTELEGK